MTTPTVVEMPRRLEPISRDTFIGGGEPLSSPGVVVPLRPSSGAPRRPRPRRGGSPPQRPAPDGFDAA